MRDTLFSRACKAHQLGLEAIGAGHYREAVDLLRGAATTRPCGRYWANLSVALERVAVDLEPDPERRQALLEKAVAASLEAIRLRPRFHECMGNLALVLESLGRMDEAVLWWEKAATLAPRSAEAAWGCACAAAKLERWPEAAGWYARVLALKPNLDVAAGNLVSTLSSACRHAEALHVSHTALRRSPGNAVAWSNTGCVLRRLGSNGAALDCYDQALLLHPHLATAAWARSLCLLALGDTGAGWDAYEWGLHTGDRQPVRRFPQPRWDGSSPAGKTILVWMEQGLGDQILWAGMLPDLVAKGLHVVVECEHRLTALLQRSFPAAEVVPQTLPPHERTQSPDIGYQIPAGSLPRILRPGIGSFPQHGGYLTPDPARAAGWKGRVASLGPGLKVGVSWRSLKTGGVRSMDCMRLSQWGPILSTPGVHWINLQCGWTEAELLEAGDSVHAPLHVWDGMDLKDDQDGLAALICNLDLVVTAFTVTAQLAGALGVPCWVLDHEGNQSWFKLGTDYCPWHPKIRFFPCGAMEPWDTAIESLAAELRKLCG
jgi:hypothetical protein